MSEQEDQKDFVREWIKVETKTHAESQIVKAIVQHTEGNELDEAKFLALLKKMAKQESKGDE